MRQTALPRRKHPIGFRLWFGFVAALVASILVGTAYLLITIGSDPARLGRFFGAVVEGYEQNAAPRPQGGPAR